jgi:hypothetical protein
VSLRGTSDLAPARVALTLGYVVLEKLVAAFERVPVEGSGSLRPSSEVVRTWSRHGGVTWL